MVNSRNRFSAAILLSLFTVLSLCATAANAVSSTGGDNGARSITNAKTGNLFWTDSVYQGSGLSAPDLTFNYSSLSATYSSNAGSGGRGWSHSYSGAIYYFRSDPTKSFPIEFATLVRADGKRYNFKPSAGVWSGNADIPGTLNKTASGWTWTPRDGSVETYDTNGKLRTITDSHGLTKTLTYDTSGRLAQVTGAFGQALTFTYYTSNLISTLTDPNGQSTTLTYDVNANLTRIQFPDATAKVYHYENVNFSNYLTGTSYDNGLGSVVRDRTIGYDASGHVNSVQRAGGVELNTASWLMYPLWTTVTDAAGTQQTISLSDPPTLGVRNVISVKNLSDNKTLTQTFDPNNNLTCKQDEEGHVTTWTYNTTNQKLSQTEGQGGTCSAPVSTATTRTTSYQYLSTTLNLPTLIETPSVYAGSKKHTSIGYTGNLPNTITQSGFTPAGAAVTRTVTMTYNNGQVATIDGARTDVTDVTTLAYNNCTTGNGCGQLQSVTNALNQITTYDSYDANGRLLQRTDPNGLKTAYTYYPRGWVHTLTQTTPGGVSRVTTYGYDAAGNVTSTTLPTGLVLTNTYDAANYLRRVTDSFGNYITYGYDLKGNRTQTYTYDVSGTLVRAVDLAFDARNRVSQINAGGSITKQISDALGNLTTVTDPNTVAVSGTAATNNSYDALNRLYQTIDRLSGSTLYSYDANDKLNTVQAPNGANTQYQYDDLGNLLKEISPDRGTVSYAYDAAGNLTQQTDARGIVSNYTYDALNRLTFINYGSGNIENVTYTYDSNTGCTFGLGRLCAVVDGSGGTAYGYDAFGNQTVQTHVELGITYSTFYTYDAGNRVTSITYPGGRVVNTPRDVLGRITSVTTTVNGTAATIASARSFRPDGLLLSQNFGNGLNEARQYDTQGRLTYSALGSADTRLYTYDANGNLKGLQSLPQVGAYTYDALDRLSLDQRTTTATTSSAFTFDANGNRKSENLGAYTYLANSNRLSTTPAGSITLDNAGNTLSDGTRSYTYNNAGQLSTVAGAGYSYNAQRLRTRKIIGSVGTVYHYDTNGNLLAESDTAGVLRRSYVWAEGQPLAQIEPVTTLPADIIVDNPQATFTGTWTTSTSIAGFYGTNYRTHGKGTGTNKAVWTLSVPTTGTYQVYARWVAASTNASNAPFTVKYSGGSKATSVSQQSNGGKWMLLGSYAFTAGTAGSVTLTDNANGTVIADAVKLTATSGGTTSEVVRYLHSDHLNTPRLATNSTGQVIWRWDGEAFGATVPNEDVDGDGKLTTVNLRFPGQYYDAESGLHYNWNRYYDSRIGRYITADPVSVGEHVQSTLDNLRSGRANDQPPLELNPYAYVANNPLKYTDPEGLACEYKGFDYGGWVIGKKMCRCIWECGCPDAKTTKYTYGRPIYIRGRDPITSKYNACTCEDARTSFP